MKRSHSTAELPAFRPLVPATSDDREFPAAPAPDEPVPAPAAEPNAVQPVPMAFPGPFAYVPRPAAIQGSNIAPDLASTASGMSEGSGEGVMTSGSLAAAYNLPNCEPAATAGGSTTAAAGDSIMLATTSENKPYGLSPLILTAAQGRRVEVQWPWQARAQDINQIHLFGAAVAGSVNVVRTLLTRKDIVIDQTNGDGCSAMYIAAAGNKSAVVACLLSAGAEVNLVCDLQRRTALITASGRGHVDVVKTLLTRKDVALDETDVYGWSALFIAACENRPEVVACLLAAGAKVNLACGLQRCTALATASGRGHVEVVKTLLAQKDIAIDQTYANGLSALFIAACADERKVVACLLAAGANVNLACGPLRRNALIEAAAQGHVAMVKTLLTCKDVVLGGTDAHGWSALLIAADENQPEVVACLLTAGADVNQGCDKKRYTALIVAATRGHIDVVKTLITSKDIALDQTCADGFSALSRATLQNEPDVVACLLTAGANVNLVCGPSRRTALISAADLGRLEVVKTLLTCKDIALDETDLEGRSALCCAASSDRPEVVACLLAAGASVNLGKAGRDRHTALMLAAARGHVDVVKTLLTRQDIALDKTDDRERSALFFAALRNKPDAVACLLAAGASMTVADAHGRTPTTIAIEKKHAAVLELLVQHGARLPRFRHVDPAQPPAAIAFAVTRADLEADRTLPADPQDNPFGLAAPHSMDDPLAVIDEFLNVLELEQDLQQWLRAKGIRMACVLPVLDCLVSLTDAWLVLANSAQAANAHQERLICAAALSRLSVLTAEGKALAHYQAAGISAAGLERLSAVATLQIEKMIAVSDQVLTSMGSVMLDKLVQDCLARTNSSHEVEMEALNASLVSAGWLPPLAEAIAMSWKAALAVLESEPFSIPAGSTMKQVTQRLRDNIEGKAPQILAQVMQRKLAAPTLLASLRTWLGDAQSVEALDLLFQIQCDHLRQYCEQTLNFSDSTPNTSSTASTSSTSSTTSSFGQQSYEPAQQ